MPSTVYLHHRLKAKGTLDYWAEPLTESKQPFSLYEWSQVCHHSEWKVTHQREQTGAGGRGGISHCPTLRRCSGVDTSSSLCLSNMHMWLNILLLRTFSTLVFYKNGSSDLLILEKKKRKSLRMSSNSTLQYKRVSLLLRFPKSKMICWCVISLCPSKSINKQK